MRYSASALIALIACVAAAVSADSLAGYHPVQLQALDILYNSTGGPNWKRNSEWTNPLYCLRTGVTCDALRNVIALYVDKSLS
jgi:hypothetical protein